MLARLAAVSTLLRTELQGADIDAMLSEDPQLLMQDPASISKGSHLTHKLLLQASEVACPGSILIEQATWPFQWCHRQAAVCRAGGTAQLVGCRCQGTRLAGGSALPLTPTVQGMHVASTADFWLAQ